MKTERREKKEKERVSTEMKSKRDQKGKSAATVIFTGPNAFGTFKSCNNFLVMFITCRNCF